MTNKTKRYLPFISLLFIMGCFLFTYAFPDGNPADNTTHITILYDNDVHGHLIPFDDSRSGKDIGGAARRTSLMKQLKQENPNTLILDAGDWLSGTPISGFFKGEADWGTFAKMPYDAIVIGNHDFDYGQESLRDFIKTSKIPVLSANIQDVNANKLLATPYIIKTIGGVTIAILGVTTPSTPTITQPKNVIGLRFDRPEDITQKYLPELKKKADIIVLLSHLGHSEDLSLAKKVPGIDVIVGGHSHTKVNSYDKANDTYVVQAFQWGIFLGKMDLSIVDKKLVAVDAKLISVDSSMQEDPELAKYLKPYADQIIDKMAAVVGKSDVDLVKPSYSDSQTNLADWICDVLRIKAKTDIAMQNVGGVRASLSKGNLTYNDIYSVLPFENALVVLEAKGTLVQEILDQLSDKIQKAQETGSVSGVTFDIKDGKAINIIIGGKPMEADTTYTIAVNDFMANGGSGYSVLKNAKLVHYDAVLRDVVIDYLKEHPTISPVAEERFKVIQ
jgi:5'-nucleotidase/UDP-sugar diphosphatase